MITEFWQAAAQILDAEKDLPFFKTWINLMAIPLYSYGNNDGLSYYYDENYKLLENRPDAHVFLSALEEPKIGHTTKSYQVASLVFQGVPATTWTLKTMYALLTFEHMSGKSIHDYEQIVEFGAGIGETCRMIRDLNYKGDMYILDLPEVARISNYYLNDQLKKNVKIAYNYLAVPNDKKTLFIGTWSLSEVPIDYRNELVQYFRGSDFYIIFQKEIFKYDNLDYFLNVFPEQSYTKCQMIEFEDDFHPNEESHSYHLVGHSHH